VGGDDLIECEDLDEAIEVASKHPVARFGTVGLAGSDRSGEPETDHGPEGWRMFRPLGP
jgi:hypothetical protein